MKLPLPKKVIACAALIALCVGCVIRTESKIDAHITLDIRHVADQASDILDYVEGKKSDIPEPVEKPASGKTSMFERAVDILAPMPVAYADGMKITTSPLVKEIAQKLRQRHATIDALKKKNCLGESNRGYLELRQCDDVRDPGKKNAVQQLLAEENKDRKALYKEIARLNEKDGVSVSTVEIVYAMERLKRATSGEIFQLPSVGPEYESYKATPAGQKLASKCIPDAWVVIP